MDLTGQPLPAVIPLVASRVHQAAALMARAFHADPFFTFVLPVENRRRRVLPWLFAREIAYGLRYGRVLTIASIQGLALWLGPQRPTIGLVGSLLTGLFLLPLKLTLPELVRSMRLEMTAQALHKRAARGRHWHLLVLGVEPSAQGRGLGGALLQPILTTADREGLVCYTETNNPQNIPFYECYGFSVIAREQADSPAPTTWALCREPIP